jgi:hypothetical protein
MQLKFKDTFWHPECMKCSGPCGKPLGPSDKLFAKDGMPCCEVRTLWRKWMVFFFCLCTATFWVVDLLLIDSREVCGVWSSSVIHACCGAWKKVPQGVFGEALIELLLLTFWNRISWHVPMQKCIACDVGFPDGKMFNRSGWPACVAHARGKTTLRFHVPVLLTFLRSAGELPPEVLDKIASRAANTS